MGSIEVKQKSREKGMQAGIDSMNIGQDSSKAGMHAGTDSTNVNQENLRQFDRRFVQTQDIQTVGYRLVCGILLLCAGVLACVPVTMSLEFIWLNGLLLSVAVILYISPYVVVNEQGKNYSVYEKMKWLPVPKKALLKNRILYVTRFLLILLAAGIILQLISCGLSRKVNIMTMLYPVGWSLVAYVAGIISCLNGYHRG